MTTPVMNGAFTPTIGLSPYAAVLKAKTAAAAAGQQGAGFVSRIVAKLGLGRFGTYALRGWGFVAGRVALVVNYFGVKTSIAYLSTSEVGQSFIKSAVRLAAAPLAWAATKVYDGLVWALSKIRCERVVTLPVAFGMTLGYSVASWTGAKLSNLLDPQRVWMQAINTVAAFRVHWALAGMSFIPGPIGFLAKTLVIISTGVKVVMLVGSFIGFRSEDAVVAVEDTMEWAKDRATEKTEQAQHKAQQTVANIADETSKKLAEAQRIAESLGAEVIGQTETDEEIAFRYLDTHGREAMARAVLAGEVPAVAKVMSKNQAKRDLREIELENKIIPDRTK
jgi:hypothetical protein